MINTKFVEEMKKLFGNEKILNDFLKKSKSPLKKSIKINLSKISYKIFVNQTKNNGYKLSDPGFLGKNNDVYYIDREQIKTALGKTFLHQSGFFYIQEIAASMPAKLIGHKNNDLILDMCASPGGKTIQISDNLNKNGDIGFVISNDFDKSRLKALSHNVNRIGSTNVGITNINGFLIGEQYPNFFDHILLDAPCSGEGTGYKSNSAMNYWRQEETNKICGIQKKLLISAINSVKIGGDIVYSTCTINPYENEIMINNIQKKFGGSIEIENVDIKGKSLGISRYGNQKIIDEDIAYKCARFWPHIQGTGGFFISKIRKLDSLSNTTLNKNTYLKNLKKDHLVFHKKLQKTVLEYLFENFGIKINLNKYLFLSDNKYIYITNKKFLDLKGLFPFQKIGVPIIKINKDKSFRPLHYLGTILGDEAEYNIIKLDFDQAQYYSEYNDIDAKQINIENLKPNNKYTILKWGKFGISIGKIVGSNIKNMYLRS